MYLNRKRCVLSISKNDRCDIILIDNMTSYTVSEINDIVKKTIQTEFKNKIITVTGEISNVKPSGRHTYLTLKDDNASISVIFWGTQLNNEHGDNVEITGKIELYTKTGNVNIIGNEIKIIGVGSLHTEYEKIKNDYEKKVTLIIENTYRQLLKRLALLHPQEVLLYRIFYMY